MSDQARALARSAHQRRRLAQVARCPRCGAWSYAGVCTTPHEPAECTALTGSCTCQWCRCAASDREAPLDLGGRWVKTGRGTKVWRPA